jgi:predicted O-methyltransferase YrrM
MRFLMELRLLPPAVALFQWRARRLALRMGDSFSAVSATQPRRLKELLRAAHGSRRVVELGTGTAWTSLSLALADRQRTVLSYDSIERPERERYLRLVSPEVRRRLTFVSGPGEMGPPDDDRVDFLFIDSSHEREATIREMQAWRVALEDGSVVVFDDYSHPNYPGVEEAVRHLGLDGEERLGLFVHRVSAPSQPARGTEGGGFEPPSEECPPKRFSRPPHSTTLPPFHGKPQG